MSRESTEHRKEQIAEAALRILAEDGARRLTAQHLADSLSLTPGALFRHYPTMSAILDAVLDRAEHLLFAEFPEAGDDPIACLRAFFFQRVGVIQAHPELSRLLLSGELERIGSQAHAERVRGFKRRTQSFVLACLKRAGRQKRLAPDLTPEVGLVLVVGAVLSLAHTSTHIQGKRKRERFIESVWEALFVRLAPLPPQSDHRNQPLS